MQLMASSVLVAVLLLTIEPHLIIIAGVVSYRSTWKIPHLI